MDLMRAQVTLSSKLIRIIRLYTIDIILPVYICDVIMCFIYNVLQFLILLLSGKSIIMTNNNIFFY